MSEVTEGADDTLQRAPASTRRGVFISHVNEDKPIADALEILVQDITAGAVRTFASSSRTPGQGIRYGDEWFQWIRSKIEVADHLVALLTPNSLGRPWILFEAGLGKAQPSGSVFGLAVGVAVDQASAGPFGVFQNSGSDRDSLIKLCKQLIEPSGLKPRDEVIGVMVDQFLGSISTVVAAPVTGSADEGTAAIYQALEDLKFLIRERGVSESRDGRRRRDVDVEQLLLLMDRGRPARPGSRVELALLGECASELGLSAVAAVLRTASGPGGISIRHFDLAMHVVEETRPFSRASDRLLQLVRDHLLMWRDEQERELQRRRLRSERLRERQVDERVASDEGVDEGVPSGDDTDDG